MASKMKANTKKSIQNQTLTEEEMLETFTEMERYQDAIQERKNSIKNLQTQIEYFAKNSQEQLHLTREMESLINLNMKATKSRFELFLKLIVRVRNQYTVKGSYTKRHFLVEAKKYLDMVEFEVK